MRLLGEMEERVDELVEATLERVGQRIQTGKPIPRSSLKQAADFARRDPRPVCRDSVHDSLPAQCPGIAAVAARIIARTGELEAFANGYRSAQAALWGTWFCLIEDSGLDGSSAAPPLSRGSDFFFHYADLLADFITDIYRDEVDAN